MNFQETQFADLDWHPCSPVEDGLLTAGTALLMLAPFIIIFAFAVA